MIWTLIKAIWTDLMVILMLGCSLYSWHYGEKLEAIYYVIMAVLFQGVGLKYLLRRILKR